MAAPVPVASTGDCAAVAVVEPGVDWVVSSANNVCGVNDARQISNPAKVNYGSLLAATPEIKEMKRKGIDQESPEGQILHNKAVDRIRTAASNVMASQGHCSVWRKIRHKKGRAVADITAEVKKQL